jgi:mannose-6-phosphate isomerase-like protein (cupin superfamily)
MGSLIIQAASLQEVQGRADYGIRRLQDHLKHWVIWRTTPGNPFKPHKHGGWEFWFILEGEAVVKLDGEEYPVESGDLIYLPPAVEHGLRTDSSARWICLGNLLRETIQEEE